MTPKLYLIIGGVVASSYLLGRYSAPEKIKIETKVETKIEVVKDEHKADDSRKSIIEVTRKDGTKITRTVIQNAIRSDIESRVKTVESKAESKTIEARRGVQVNALIGMPLSHLTDGPVYGASFSKPFIGPLSIGGFMFTDLRVGVSVGMEF